MAESVIRKLPKFLHGGDYNPDQWLDRPDILEEDIRLMKKAHVNCVSLGIFAWDKLEPEEGVYNFGWLEERIDALYKEGIYTILATPTGAMPNWLTKRYEEVRQVDSNLVRNLAGKRHNFCYTSPVMRNKTRALDEALAKRFGQHPGVILWHISNELGNNFGDGACHCPLCQAAFRDWLKVRYKTLDALNAAWWTSFWAHTYTDWEQLHSPVGQGETLLHGQVLDWKRFVTEQMRDFYREEVKAVRIWSDLPVTTNMMWFFKSLDYNRFSGDIDIISWDAYPNWHSEVDEVNVAVEAAVNHNIMRSLKKAPFLLMESTPSITNWAVNNIQKRPGMHELASMQAVALGSNSVQYFQWRKSRGSSEKFHGAVVGHDGTANTRIFKETAGVGKRLAGLPRELYNTCQKPRTAIIFDWESWWGIDEALGPRQEMDYTKTITDHYKPFWEMGIDVDIIGMDQELSGYRLVIAPMAYMLKDGYAKRVKAFVERGGVYVTTYWSNLVNESDLCFTGENPLAELLGIQVEETDALNEYFRNSIAWEGNSYDAGDLCDIIHCTGAEVMAVYGQDYYAGTPAITRNKAGAGQAWYIAARGEASLLKALYGRIVEEAGVEKNIDTALPYGVTVNRRVGEKTYYFIQNFNKTGCEIILPGRYKNAGEEGTISGSLMLEPYACVILEDA